jgi:hypothetical protein
MPALRAPDRWIRYGCCVCMLLLCSTGGAQPGAQKDQRSLGMRVAYALDDPWPVFKVISEHGDKVVDAIGTHPLGKIPVAVYKVTDFTRLVGVAANEREDKSLGASMILVNADAALLKGMHARGLDLNTDPRAIAAKQRLQVLTEDLNSGDEGNLSHLLGVVGKHLPYALAEVAMDKAISAGVEKLVKWGEPAIDKALPIGDEVKSILGNRSGLASGLRYMGWRKLGSRADLAKKYTDKLMHKLIQAKLDELVQAQLKEMFGDALDNLYKEVMEDHPSQLRRTVISRPMLYASLIAQPALALAAVAAPAPAPALVTPAQAEAAPVVQISKDRVVNSIRVEDSYVRWSVQTNRTTYHPPPPPTPEPVHQPTEREIQFRRELMCQGTSHKPGCGCWDGSRNCSLTGR